VLLQEITASTARAEKKKAEVQVVKGALNPTPTPYPLPPTPTPIPTPTPDQVVKDALGLEAGAIADVKGGIEKELAAAGPALEEAETALRSIKAQDIGLLKNLKQPPNLIQRLFDCVLVLMRGQLNVVEVQLPLPLPLPLSLTLRLPLPLTLPLTPTLTRSARSRSGWCSSTRGSSPCLR